MQELPRTPIVTRRSKQRDQRMIVVVVLVIFAAVLLFAARDVFTQPSDEAETATNPPATGETQAVGHQPTVETARNESQLIDDDGKTLWVSPTDGPPLDLAYLPPGVEIVLALRPAELLAHSEGEKVVSALGPPANDAAAAVERTTGMPLRDIEVLIFGWRMQLNVGWDTTRILRVRSDLAPSEIRARLKQHLSYSFSDRTFVFAGDQVYFMKTGRGGPALVDGTLDVFAELFPREPLFPRDVGRLIAHTETARQVTLIFRPPFVFGDQHSLFTGALAPLKPALESFLGEDIGAAALSLNWDENFFVELVAVPTLDSSPEQRSKALAARVIELPSLVEDFVLGIEASPHSRRVVARLPEMVRRLAAYTRQGFNHDAAVLRCYLPVEAGHNLLMGAELALAEGNRGVDGLPPLANASSPITIAERLQKKASLRFAREELEAALEMLAADVGVSIVIRGADLQLDGITRNQLFAIDIEDRPADEILVEILRRANPDKSATGPSDPRQKLVYTVGPAAVFITTRAKAADRGEQLPAAFQPK